VQAMESAIARVREAVKGESLDAIRTATEALQKSSHAMAEQLYRQQASPDAAKPSDKNDVVDGEVVDA